LRDEKSFKNISKKSIGLLDKVKIAIRLCFALARKAILRKASEWQVGK
jgi:hypothetical protein